MVSSYESRNLKLLSSFIHSDVVFFNLFIVTASNYSIVIAAAEDWTSPMIPLVTRTVSLRAVMRRRGREGG